MSPSVNFPEKYIIGVFVLVRKQMINKFFKKIRNTALFY